MQYSMAITTPQNTKSIFLTSADESDIKKEIRSLKTNSTGYDDMSTKVLTLC